MTPVSTVRRYIRPLLSLVSSPVLDSSRALTTGIELKSHYYYFGNPGIHRMTFALYSAQRSIKYWMASNAAAGGKKVYDSSVVEELRATQLLHPGYEFQRRRADGGGISMESQKRTKKDSGPRPVELNAKGIPVGTVRKDLIYAMSLVVCHSDIFPPCETWSQHKAAKRVLKLRTEFKSKVQKCRTARECNSMDHALGRTYLEYWAHQYFQVFGKQPSVAQFFRKTYLRSDPTLQPPGDASSQTNTSQRTVTSGSDTSGKPEQITVVSQPEQVTKGSSPGFKGISTNPEVWITLNSLNKVYEEAITDGKEEEEANEIDLKKVLGESSKRLHSVVLPKGSKRKRRATTSNQQTSIDPEKILHLEEGLMQERRERQKL